MGTKAFLQKGRGKPGLILPAGAVAKVNQANDRSALIKAAERKAAPPPPQKPVAEKPVAQDPLAAALFDRELGELAPPAEPKVETPPPPEPEVVEPPAAPVETPEPKPLDLTQLSGVGPALRRQFRNYGFGTIEAVAAADPAVLDELRGAKGRGEQWVREAKKLLDE